MAELKELLTPKLFPSLQLRSNIEIIRQFMIIEFGESHVNKHITFHQKSDNFQKIEKAIAKKIFLLKLPATFQTELCSILRHMCRELSIGWTKLNEFFKPEQIVMQKIIWTPEGRIDLPQTFLMNSSAMPKDAAFKAACEFCCHTYLENNMEEFKEYISDKQFIQRESLMGYWKCLYEGDDLTDINYSDLCLFAGYNQNYLAVRYMWPFLTATQKYGCFEYLLQVIADIGKGTEHTSIILDLIKTLSLPQMRHIITKFGPLLFPLLSLYYLYPDFSLEIHKLLCKLNWITSEDYTQFYGHILYSEYISPINERRKDLFRLYWSTTAHQMDLSNSIPYLVKLTKWVDVTFRDKGLIELLFAHKDYLAAKNDILSERYGVYIYVSYVFLSTLYKLRKN